MSRLRIAARDCGYWPTPNTGDGVRGARKPDGRRGLLLTDCAREGSPKWPTPCTPNGGRVNRPEDIANKGRRPDGRKVQVSLESAVKMWPTPTVDGNYNNAGLSAKSGAGLATAVKKWPTPNATDGTKAPKFFARGNPSLPQAVKTYPTPQARDGKGEFKNHTKGGRDLSSEVARGGTSTRRTYPTPTNSMMTVGDMEQARFAGIDPRRPSYEDANKSAVLGQLNPEWVAWLMGWPIGASACEPLATDRFQRWWRLHGGCCPKD